MARIDDDGDAHYPDDGGTSDDGTTDDGTNGGGGNSFSIPENLADLGFESLGKYADQLVRIAKNPKSFVIGALVAWILGGILEVTYIFFDGIRIALVGTGLGYAEGDVAGIEDLMYIAWDIISGAGEAIGSPILDIVSTIQTSLTGLAESAGLFSFPLTVGMLAIFLVASYIVLNRVGWATLAAIPIVGPMMEALFK